MLGQERAALAIELGLGDYAAGSKTVELLDFACDAVARNDLLLMSSLLMRLKPLAVLVGDRASE